MKGHKVNRQQNICNYAKYINKIQLVVVLMINVQSIVLATEGIMPGSGTIESPFLVSDYSDLKVIGTNTIYDLNMVYRLVKDIDASASRTENSDSGFVPIGLNRNPFTFTGTFQGAGHAIKNIYINRPNVYGVGLFTGLNGMIDSLGLVDNNISGLGHVGGISGSNWSGTISNCYNTGNVNGSSFNVGGIVGYNYGGSIINCHNTAEVFGLYNVGGIAGYNTANGDDKGTILNCYNKGNVSASSNTAGGIVGANENGCEIKNCYNTASIYSNDGVSGIAGYSSTNCVISYCYNTGNISGSRTSVGGITGSAGYCIIFNCYNSGNIISGGGIAGGIAGGGGNSIHDCYNTGSVYSSYSVGGIVGEIGDSCSTTNCYNTGDVFGFRYIGGITGTNFSGTINCCYNIGSVNGSFIYAGGIVGENYNGIIENCYWNIETSKQSSGYGHNSATIRAVNGLSTAEMKYLSNLNNFDFLNTWTIRNDSTYPGLQTMNNNAPFAFNDSLSSARIFRLSQLLLNDCDIETANQNLVLKLTSTKFGITDSISTLEFPYTVANGMIDTLKYRVGEIRAAIGDTLWGNIATAILTLDTTIAIVDQTKYIVPNKFELKQNYPNPFNPNTTITFVVPVQSVVTLKIYDLLGKEVITLMNKETVSAGYQTKQWHAEGFPSGVYFYRLQSGLFIETKRLILIK
jgi:hypothetical protein